MTATATAPPRTKRDEAATRKTIAFGAPPRVSLVPPEIGQRTKQLSVQRNLRLLMVLVLVLVLGGVAAAWYYQFSTAIALAGEMSRTAALTSQEAQYADVDQALEDVAIGETALAVGGSTEINWLDYLGRVQASLPAGVVLDSYDVDAATATEQYKQSDSPLQGARIATLQFTALSPALPEIPAWLDSLRKLPGFVDANPGSVTLQEAGTGYTASITMHIDAEAYSNRLVLEKKDAAETTADTEETDK